MRECVRGKGQQLECYRKRRIISYLCAADLEGVGLYYLVCSRGVMENYVSTQNPEEEIRVSMEELSLTATRYSSHSAIQSRALGEKFYLKSCESFHFPFRIEGPVYLWSTTRPQTCRKPGLQSLSTSISRRYHHWLRETLYRPNSTSVIHSRAPCRPSIPNACKPIPSKH